MQSLESLPDIPLRPGDRTSAPFLAAGIADFRAAARYLYRLPYGSNTDRADFRLVLTEEWAATTDVVGRRSWEELWRIREA